VTTDATVTFTATDNQGGSGVAATYYTIDGGAQQTGATATVTTFDARGDKVGSDLLRLPAGSTTSWKPPARATYLMVSPGDGAVYGTVLVSGPGVAELPLESIPLSLERPVVEPGYSSP